MGFRLVIPTLLFMVLTGGTAFAKQKTAPILYPLNHAIVGERVNLVLDPSTDWSAIPFFQVIAGNKDYPVVDTSTMKHAVQGVRLEPGLNTITVKYFTRPAGKKKDRRLLGSRTVQVYSKNDLFTGGVVPPRFAPRPFHSRKNEKSCSNCHRMNVKPEDANPAKPERMLCYACHKNVPTGEHVHGPAAVWTCLSCHNPKLYPVKYQFSPAGSLRVNKVAEAVKPVLFTIPAGPLFKPESAILILGKEREQELFQTIRSSLTTLSSDSRIYLEDRRRDDPRALFKGVLSYIRRNPGDNMLLEVHTATRPDTGAVYKNPKLLSQARARSLARFLRRFGVPSRKITAVGRGDAFPRASNFTESGRKQNNRIEIVFHPSDVRVKNSRTLPKITDRERVQVNIVYGKGTPIRRVRVIEKLPKKSWYLKGSGRFRGKRKKPVIKGKTLVWNLGNLGNEFSDVLTYVVKKPSPSRAVSSRLKVTYRSGRDTVSRVFSKELSAKRGLTISENCRKCHETILSGPFKHGPADAGYCTICHNPHASPYASWLKKPWWELCVTCHGRMATGRHVVAGFVSGTGHPTKDRRDPSRPGKKISCASCHEPHSAQSRSLYTHGAKSRFELCKVCHEKI